ncbi:hypothetical protein [Helicobacter pylori]|uniref:hypothetical protein n=1 Tax=Helicobacter pylori TaxID=210 RepID=UPI001F2E226D|nr:hypothetical protein [Helicobacter pylori]UGW75608.1 hypothetical protein LUA78_01720 [Helicobacter pylori]UGW82267.1 hypothetical protein LUA77_02030 [Helicobacter pylori]WQV32348.1 hypothetical protein KVM44_04790 [Helicobacter pylori]
MQIYKPYCYIISILAIPFIFLGVSHYFLDFPSFLASYNYLKKIILNLHNFPHFKFEIYFSFFCALLPLFLTAYLFFNGRNMDSHGKAVWAEMKDIIKYELVVSSFTLLPVFIGCIFYKVYHFAKKRPKVFFTILSFLVVICVLIFVFRGFLSVKLTLFMKYLKGLF